MTDAPELLSQLQAIKKTVAEWMYCYHARANAAGKYGMMADQWQYFNGKFYALEDKLLDLLEQTPASDDMEEMKRKVKEYRL